MKLLVSATNRADIGHLTPLIEQSFNYSEIKLTVLLNEIIHKSNEFELTNSIKSFNGVELKYFKYSRSNDDPKAQLDIVNDIISNLSNFFSNQTFDFAIVLGDRFETSIISQILFEFRIPIVHLHGGENTEGSRDNYYRSIISRIAKIHFVSNISYANNLKKIGIPQTSIFNYGALAVERISKMQEKEPLHLKRKFGIHHENYYLFTFHPSTAHLNNGIDELKKLIEILSMHCSYPIYITKSNVDHGGIEFNEYLLSCVLNYPGKFYFIKNDLGEDFLNILHESIAIIGNSSSGVIEAPLLNLPSINVGDRQKGRVITQSVFSVGSDIRKLKYAINMIEKSFIKRNRSKITLNKKFLGNGKTSKKIIEKLIFIYRKIDE